MSKLHTTTDRRHALKIAIERAAEDRVDDLWTWDADKIDRYYENLLDGRMRMNVELAHPNDIEPIDPTPATGPVPPIGRPNFAGLANL